MSESLTHTVTGATGYTGRYITRLLLEEGHTVQSITGHPQRPNPFGDRVALHPFNFDRPDLLEETLAGTDTLFNTYWIRVNYGNRTHERCVEETRVLFDAAKSPGFGASSMSASPTRTRTRRCHTSEARDSWKMRCAHSACHTPFSVPPSCTARKTYS